MVVLGWVVTAFWVLGALACGMVASEMTSEWISPYASPTQRILYHVTAGRADTAWFCGGVAMGMAAVTAICTVGLTLLRRMAADLARLKADTTQDRRERQSDAAAILERLPPLPEG